MHVELTDEQRNTIKDTFLEFGYPEDPTYGQAYVDILVLLGFNATLKHADRGCGDGHYIEIRGYGSRKRPSIKAMQDASDLKSYEAMEALKASLKANV